MTKPSATRTEYRYVGAHVDDLADGRTLEPGGSYRLTADESAHPHNQQRIAEGLLVEVDAGAGKDGE